MRKLTIEVLDVDFEVLLRALKSYLKVIKGWYMVV